MYSKIYGPVIKFCENQDDAFITDNIDAKFHNNSIKPLTPGHPSASKYIKAVSKLFKQITISQSNLWIVPTIGISSVRIYFSDPIIYPISTCCQKCVYIDIQTNLNGSIICPSCNMILISFIHYQDTEDRNGNCSAIDKQVLFREKKKQNALKNRLMYQNLTSNRFKTKNLKKVLQNLSNQSQKNLNGKFMIESSSIPKNKQLKQVQSDKGGFIIQIRASLLKSKINFTKSQNDNFPFLKQAYRSQIASFQGKTKQELEHQLSIEQSRKIVFDIFC